jgi:signal transduction histidine kinase
MATRKQGYQNQKSLVGVGILLGLAWFLVSFNTARAIETDSSLFSKVVAGAIPTALALALVVGASGILFYELYDEVFAIAKWTVFGLCAFTLAAALNILGVNFVQLNYKLILYVLLNAAAGGAVLGLMVGLYNARQRRLQAELELEHQRAVTLSQRLSVINRVLRHDTRNQAQIIQSETDKLLNGGQHPESTAREIQDANKRLTELAEQARKLQAMLSGEDSNREVLDIVTLFERASASVQERQQALTLDVDLPDEQLVFASPLLEDALEHILRNAAQHDDSDTPHAHITVRTDEARALPVELTVTDTGPGIPESEPILSGDSNESQLHHSNGFGLWFVKWVVEDVGGEVSFETPADDDIGTVVTVRLPEPPAERVSFVRRR